MRNSFCYLANAQAPKITIFDEVHMLILHFFDKIKCCEHVRLLHIKINDVNYVFRKTSTKIMNLMHWICSRSATIARERMATQLK